MWLDSEEFKSIANPSIFDLSQSKQSIKSIIPIFSKASRRSVKTKNSKQTADNHFDRSCYPQYPYPVHSMIPCKSLIYFYIFMQNTSILKNILNEVVET
jgi:hypothetical protein